MTFSALYAIIVSIAMIGQWALTLIKKQVPEPEAGSIVGRGAVEMFFHKIAELITAIALLAGGVGLLLERPWASRVYLISLGMLLYTVINSSGYFAQKREWPMVGVFAVILACGLVSLGLVL